MQRTRGVRHRLTNNELASRYVRTLLAAAVAAVLGAWSTATILRRRHVGCELTSEGGGPSTWVCPDGVGYAVPASCGGVALALVVIGSTAVLTGRHADVATMRRMSRHAMWLVLFVTLVPVVGWTTLALLSANASGLLGVAGTALLTSPLIAAYHWPKALPAVLGLDLLAAVAVLVLWRELLLLLPLAVAVAGGWAIALALWLWASRLGLSRSRPGGRAASGVDQ